MRGSDIDHNPVFESYAIIFHDRAICFCHKSEENLKKFCPEWEFRPYEEYKLFLKKVSNDKSLKVWIDPSSVSMGIRSIFSEHKYLSSINRFFVDQIHSQFVERLNTIFENYRVS